MKKNKYWLLPVALLIFGASFYVYYGINYNAWMDNLPNIIIFIIIVIALAWALWKKKQMEDERNNRDGR